MSVTIATIWNTHCDLRSTTTTRLKCSVISDYYFIIGSSSLIGNTLGGKNGLHAFGNNSAESEPIWMKSGKKPNVGAGPGRFWARSVATVWEVSFFPKKSKKNGSQNFQVLQLQAVITPQWLQIAGRSPPNGLSTGCLVSIFTVRINSKSFSEMYVPYKKSTSPNFRQRPILRNKTNSTPQCWCKHSAHQAIYWRKADWIGNCK